ncbi:MAG TPA: 23S rRNA (adenine(2503)-C(2))-methyltransferase RlmN [Thermoanaerobaculia bacterium]|nr:23S rRNA (adenine(2503)-C(2))-methyltransferase RlmN [Thermoanaerobaculia bacterium]
MALTDTNLGGMEPAELEAFFADLGEPRYRATQVFRRIHHHRARALDEWSELPLGLRARLASAGVVDRLEVVERARGEDGTEKVILALPAVSLGDARGKSGPSGAREIEAVWIPGGDRRTVCISSQVGCSLDCSFCATGTLRFRGNLEPWQIVDQVYALERLRGERASNVVFMGMGEPFHNYERVMRAAHLLHHPEGAHLGARHITISTAGVTPGVERFTAEKEPWNLAISLNHPDPEARAVIMPITVRHPLPELLDAARRYTVERRRRITFEYVMMPGVNMGRREVEQLTAIGRSMRCKINLIPLNTAPEASSGGRAAPAMPAAISGSRRPTAEEAHSFHRALVDAGLQVFDRGSPGREVEGACGMLALRRMTTR